MQSEKIIELYFNYWNKQDLELLKTLFSKNVTLEDWEAKYEGIDSVIEANKNIFTKDPSIKINVIHVFDNKNEFAVLIDVLISDKKILSVIDLIKIENGLITFVKAFKKLLDS
tara:strand:- start:568 stop:906 length:339 start_codon:yes stop_codon:yes gene_type:complete